MGAVDSYCVALSQAVSVAHTRSVLVVAATLMYSVVVEQTESSTQFQVPTGR